MNHSQVSFENVKFRRQVRPTKNPVSVNAPSLNLPFETERSLIRNYTGHYDEESLPGDSQNLVHIQRCQEKIAENGLFGESYILEYLNDQRRRCGRPKTIQNTYTNILLFVKYLKQIGHSCITTTTRKDLSGFIEQEQDRGLKPGTIATTLRSLYAFLAYLADQDVVSFDLLRKKFHLFLHGTIFF